MQITNNYGLPGAIVEAVRNDQYDPGESHITATSLIKPPRIRVMELRHDDEIKEDASSRLWALMGKAAHNVLEGAEPSALVELRLYGVYQGWLVGGKFDRTTLRQATLQDYKLASVWELMFGLKPERVAQLNILADLAIRTGYPITRLEIVHLARDWQNTRALASKDYPQRPFQRVPVPLWSAAERWEYISTRVALHQAAESMPDDMLPLCTDEERWARPTTYAVMKNTNKRATKVCDSMDQAVDAMAKLEDAYPKAKFSIVERPGGYARCDGGYCPVKRWCDQYPDEAEEAPVAAAA